MGGEENADLRMYTRLPRARGGPRSISRGFNRISALQVYAATPFALHERQLIQSGQTHLQADLARSSLPSRAPSPGPSPLHQTHPGRLPACSNKAPDCSAASKHKSRMPQCPSTYYSGVFLTLQMLCQGLQAQCATMTLEQLQRAQSRPVAMSKEASS